MIMNAKKEIYTLDEAFVFALAICNDDEKVYEAVDIIRECQEEIPMDIESYKIAFIADQTKGFLRAVNDIERELFKLVEERYFYAHVSKDDIERENNGCCDCCGSHAITQK